MPMSQVFAQIRNEYEKKGHPREELGPGHLKVGSSTDIELSIIAHIHNIGTALV